MLYRRFLRLLDFIFTLFQLVWAYIWASKHVKIRANRKYANGKSPVATDKQYKALSIGVFFIQNIVCIASFWSNSSILLKIHDSDVFRFFGAIVLLGSTTTYFVALRHLGRNYSPCYDSHTPHELVKSGPYKLVRHPMYLAKLLIGVGTFFLSGSLLLLPILVWLFFAMIRAIRVEELDRRTKI